MIEEDDTNVEYVRCTCLDRARIALRQTGQHHCAEQMGLLQKEFDDAAEEFDLDPSKPLEIMDHVRVLSIIARVFMEYEGNEKKRSHPAG